MLVAAIDAAIAGDDNDIPLADRAEFASLGVGTRSQRLRAAAGIITQALVGAVPLMQALQEAAASDETSRARLDRYEADRRITVAAGLQLVLGKVPTEALIDSMWVLTSSEVFVKLTKERGWTTDLYQDWIIETAEAILGSPAH